ncbi:tripartite tricarboxylate transporter TctB family protein [Pelagibacterium luteolum]|uniref:Tripartite tricarboxylate transporter TctB family protein n=1 Tax=Pelagibacterium luteolum TaxID=440168 RepID=A0A1G7ZS25_9HYPH|nr:tripartite tricarboxylate transporter TctB family protein [Pelagibacterium luteolum]SDH11336.1 Tripartite tricarboxylate transporter TctB family protein [Pelagibacterium luteolum]
MARENRIGPRLGRLVSSVPELSVALGVVTLGIFVVTEALSLGVGSMQRPGAGFAALLFGGSMTVFAAISIFEQLTLARTAASENKQTANVPKFRNLVDPLLIITLLVSYVPIMRSIGYVVSTFFFVTAIALIFSWRKWSLLLFSAVITGFAYVIFYILLGVPLPL